MPNLITLPEETIVHILARTPPLGILTCREVCRVLWQIIDTSAELQYLLELYSFGYVPPSNPRLDLSYTEKLSLLREHQRQWKTTVSTKVNTYPLRRTKTGYSSTYDFYGGVYVRGSSLHSGGHTRCLDMYQFPSVNRGVEWKQWSHSDLGVDVRDFAMEPDYDLLVLMELNDIVPDRSAPEGAPNATQYFTIHIRSLETNQPHPDAGRATIAYNCPAWTGSGCSFYFQVVGRYLAVVFLISGNRPARSHAHRLTVWDWTTGKMITYVEPTADGAESFTFINDRLFLIPRPGSEGDAGDLHRGRLDIYTFTEPMGDSPAQPARRIASLMLPELADTTATITKLSCRCDPAPSPSSQSATRHRGHPRIFQLAPDNRVLCLMIEAVIISNARGEWSQSEGTLYVPFADMLSAVAHLLGEPSSDSAVEVAWKDWAKRTSWVDTDGLHTGNECYVHGQRVVSTGVGRTDDSGTDSDSDDEGSRRSRVPILTVLDFDPIRVKHELLQSESDIEIFEPTSGNLLDFSVSEDVLRATFLEGEHKAATQCALRKTVINERLTSNHYVMVDDEHVVFVLQNRWGGESSLITYSFN